MSRQKKEFHLPGTQLKPRELEQYNQLLHPVADAVVVQKMKKYKQHGSVTTYDHCERVARTSYLISRRLHLKTRNEELVRGAMLHDLFLYDWHAEDNGEHRLHGYTHPAAALKNAKAHFKLSRREEDIIANHMWPLTLRHIPRSKEAYIVCLADKICSLEETLFMRGEQ